MTDDIQIAAWTAPSGRDYRLRAEHLDGPAWWVVLESGGGEQWREEFSMMATDGLKIGDSDT